MCCSPWGCEESDTTKQLNWTEIKTLLSISVFDTQWSTGQICLAICVCIVCELEWVLHFLMFGEKFQKNNSNPWHVKISWFSKPINKVLLEHSKLIYLVFGCFNVSKAELSTCYRHCMAHIGVVNNFPSALLDYWLRLSCNKRITGKKNKNKKLKFNSMLLFFSLVLSNSCNSMD